MTDVHSCCALSAENDRLKCWIRKLRKENAQLKTERNDALGRKPPVITRSIETQTDFTRNIPALKHPSKTCLCYCRKDMESEKFNKLLLMHSNLLRRHEKEVQLNIQHMETVAALTLKVGELEQRLVEPRTHQQHDAPSKSVDQHQQPLTPTTSTHNLSQCTQSCRHSERLHRLHQKYDRLMNSYKTLRQELLQINPSFFEEIEDLKFALQQSARLNKEYETVLRRTCSQFGVPYPHPERLLNTS